MNDPVFPGFHAPSSDFKRSRTDLQTPVLVFELDLSVARTLSAGSAAQLPIAGNFIAIDQDSDVGSARITFQDDAFSSRPARIYVQPGFKGRFPFTQLLIENAAQAGKVLRIFYGVDIDFDPSPTANVTIAGTVSTTPSPYSPGANYASTALLGALGTSQVFAPGSNVNGATIWTAQAATWAATGNRIALLAKSGAAPVSLTDGALIYMQNCIGMTGSVPVRLELPRALAAGLGLWWISEIAEVAPGGHKLVDYTLT